MNTTNGLASGFAVVTLVLTCMAAHAQSIPPTRLHCYTAGSAQPEPLGDREGHSISVSQIACRVEGGLTDGGVLTGTTIVEWDKGNGVILSGSGVTRRPGAFAAYQHLEGQVSLTMTEGKMTGSVTTGRGRITMATGAASALQGRAYSFSARTTGPGQAVVDVTYD